MKHFYYYLVFSFLLIPTLNANAKGKISGPSSTCPNTTQRYYYDDENPACDRISWRVYENGVKRTSGFVVSGNKKYIDVTWGSSGYGEVKASGQNDGGELGSCFDYQSWKSISVNILDPTPQVSGILAFCKGGQTRSFATTSYCPTSSYRWEVPAGWSINGVVRTNFTTSSTSVNITAPYSSSGTYNLRVRGNLTNGNITAWKNISVSVGPPTGGDITRTGGNLQLCPNQRYALVATGPAGVTFSNWTFQGSLSGYGSGNNASLDTYSSYRGGSVSVTMTNQCNQSTTISRTLLMDYNCGGGGYYYTTNQEVNIYPNPVNSSELTVEWPEESQVSSVQLISAKNSKKIETIIPKGNKAKFKTKNLPKGDYSVHIYTEKEVIKKRIIKE